MRPGSLLGELKRRHVLRVVGAYAVAAWIAVEVYTTIQPILLADYEWTNSYVVVLAILGFPVVFALAWIFDITPHGISRTQSLDELAGVEPAPAPPLRRRQLSVRATGFFGLGILVALVGFAAYAGGSHQARPDDDAPIRSIAVLPFADMSSSADQEFLSDGIAEELLNRLTQVPDLNVPARTSSFAFKGRNEDVRDIGRRLGVETVLEGSVRREGDRVRVQARLINVATGFPLWSETFEGSAADVFALQDQISDGIVEALKVRIAARPEAGERGTRNAGAMESYLLGLQRWHLRTDRDLRQALAHFRSAVDADSAFALAHAALAQTYAVLPMYGEFPVDSAVLLGSAAAARAIDLDPSLGDAFAAMGQIAQNFEWDLRNAERYYKRALAYSPGDATAHQWYAETLMLAGRYGEARSHLDRVLSAPSLSPSAHYSDALLKTLSGRTAEGLDASRALVARHPEFAPGALNHALTLLASGLRDEAAAATRHLGTLHPHRAAVYDAIADALAGGSAAAVPEALRAASDIAPSERAAWLVALNFHDAALDQLEAAFDAHDDPNLLLVLPHPLLRPLRDDARYRRISDDTGVVPAT
jgi:TolB-like protein/tetratricopeptide (TPR) repeat protein